MRRAVADSGWLGWGQARDLSHGFTSPGSTTLESVGSRVKFGETGFPELKLGQGQIENGLRATMGILLVLTVARKPTVAKGLVASMIDDRWELWKG